MTKFLTWYKFIEHDISRELFDETLNVLVQNHSIKSHIVGNRVRLPSPKDLQEQNRGTRPDAITSDHASDNNIKEESNKFNQGIIYP